MQVLFILFISLILAFPAFGCSPIFPGKLDKKNINNLNKILNENISEVNSNSHVRSKKVSGLGMPFLVEYEFEPHDSIDGSEIYFYLRCSNSYTEVGWKCDSFKIKRSISFDDPNDYVEILGGLDAKIAREVIEFVRKSLIIKAGRQYTYFEWGELKTSNYPLDLTIIKPTSNDEFTIYAEFDEHCTYHIIRVRRIQCGNKKCGFEIIINQVNHYL